MNFTMNNKKSPWQSCNKFLLHLLSKGGKTTLALNYFLQFPLSTVQKPWTQALCQTRCCAHNLERSLECPRPGLGTTCSSGGCSYPMKRVRMRWYLSSLHTQTILGFCENALQIPCWNKRKKKEKKKRETFKKTVLWRCQWKLCYATAQAVHNSIYFQHDFH